MRGWRVIQKWLDVKCKGGDTTSHVFLKKKQAWQIFGKDEPIGVYMFHFALTRLLKPP